MLFIRIITLLATLAASSFAGVMYDFTFTPDYGTVSSFTWQLTSSTYLTDSTSLSFTPFDMTAGSDTFSLSKATLSSRCFTFASEGTSLGNCSASPSPGNGLIQFGFMSDFNAPGTYTSMYAVTGGVTSDFRSVNGGGTVTMTVTDDSLSGSGSGGAVPEPASMALFGVGLAGVGIADRLRRTRSNQ